MALYIPHSIFHLARLLYVRQETFGPYYVYQAGNFWILLRMSGRKLMDPTTYVMPETFGPYYVRQAGNPTTYLRLSIRLIQFANMSSGQVKA